MRLALFLMLASFPILGFSTNSYIENQSRKLATQFVTLQNQNALFLEVQPKHEECLPPDRESCVRLICDKTNDCSFQGNFNEIAQACRGASGDCVKTLCEKTNDCSFRSNAMELARSCRGSNKFCVEFGCDKTKDCFFRGNAMEIAAACSGVLDSNCVQYGCEKLGSCSFRQNFISVARACAGH